MKRGVSRGPIGYGRGPLSFVQSDHAVNFTSLWGSTSTSRTPCHHVQLLVLGPRWELLLVQEWTQPTHRGYGVGGLLHKPPHCLQGVPVHRVACRDCRECHAYLLLVYVWEEEWAIVYRVVDGKERKTEYAIVLYSYPLEIEVCERNLLSGSRLHPALKKLAVEPPATVGLSLRSQLLFVMSFFTLHCVGIERVQIVVSPACSRIGLHSNCLQLPREAFFLWSCAR